MREGNHKLLLLLKSNCDQLDRIGGLQSKRGHMQEPDTKLTWMNHWNDIGVEGHREDKTRFCYFHEHWCANFQSVTLDKVYPSLAIKKGAIFLVNEPNCELISMACLQCDHYTGVFSYGKADLLEYMCSGRARDALQEK